MALPILTGVEIDPTKSSTTDWSIYFTGGTYEDNNFIKTIEPFLIRLNKNDYSNSMNGSAWNIMYNYFTGDVQLQKVGDNVCSNSVDIGGFMLLDCEIRFILPNNPCIQYNRVFATEYNPDFNHNPTLGDVCNGGSYNNSFGSSFNVYNLSIGV